nr:alpha/beta hydrolase [Rhabdothermincola salaria]
MSVTVEGGGPLVVVIHGVGVGPDSFARVVAGLGAAFRVAVVHRPGYGRAEHEVTAPLEAQVPALVEVLDRLEEPPSLVLGISGGATIALSLASSGRYPGCTYLVHEPLLGPSAPMLYDAVTTAAAALTEDADPAATVRFLAALVGEHTWTRWSDELTEVARRHDAAIRCEVPRFTAVSFDPSTLAQLADTGVALHTSVGARSGAARHQVAEVLAASAGAAVHPLADVGHLPQLDAPDRLVELLVSLAPALCCQEVRRGR